MNQANISLFLSRFVSLGERQLSKEKEALFLIRKELKALRVKYVLQKFFTSVPLVTKAKLIVDGISISTIGTSFVGGKIPGKDILISSLTSSQDFLYKANINFNPLCESVSRSNHYFAPSLAVSKNDVNRILKAKMVRGEVFVQKIRYRSANILVGNMRDPKFILFSHYDSLGPGAVDNASGVMLSLLLISEHPECLEDSLFVIAGNEELSYDQPIYWGHGYRVFEKRYKSLFRNTKKIFVLDCIGYSPTEFSQEPALVKLTLPLEDSEAVTGKVVSVSGSYQKLMGFYHSSLDKPGKVDIKTLIQTQKALIKRLC